MHQIMDSIWCKGTMPLSGTGKYSVSLGSPTTSTWNHCFPPPGIWGQNVTRNGGCQNRCIVDCSENFDLKFEIYDGTNLMRNWGKTLLPAKKALEIQGEFRGEFRRVFRQSGECFLFLLNAFVTLSAPKIDKNQDHPPELKYSNPIAFVRNSEGQD